MPTYEQLYHLNLSNLSASADRWNETANKFKTLQTSFADKVERPFKQASWTQPVFTVANAQMNLNRAKQEYQDAQIEAKGVAGVLKSLHDELKKAKDELHHLAEVEAKEQGLYVSSTGVVTPRNDLSQNQGARHDPDGQAAIREQQSKCDDFAARIERILQRAADADETACWALRRDAGAKGDFNASKVVTSLDSADADRALALAGKGPEMSDKELKQLNTLLERNKNDKEFAEKFALGMGPKGTLTFWTEMANPPRAGGSPWSDERISLLKDLQSDLGTTLGTATRSDSPAMQKWEKDVIALGDDNLETYNSGSPTGFQVMSNLMRHGQYDNHFLNDYGKSLVGYEKSAADNIDPNFLWTSAARGGYSLNVGDENDLGNDPMTGFMEALGHSRPDHSTPSAATTFFADEDNFKYLTHDREWPKDSWGGNDKIAGYDELGHALEAATTGHPYDESPTKDLPAHSEQQAEIMQRIMKGVSEDEGMARDGMQDSLGRMAAEYMPDINRAMANDQSSDMYDLFPIAGAQTEVSEQDATRFLMTVGKDPDGYAAISLGQTGYASNLMDYHLKNPDAYGPSTEEAINNIAHSSGEVQGAIGIGRRESDIGDAVEADKKYNDAMARSGSYVSGAIGTGIGVGTSFIATPAVGAAVGGVATTIAGDLVNQVVQGNEQDTKGQAVYSSGRDWEHVKHSTAAVTQDAFHAAAQAHGFQDTGDYNSIIARETTAGIVEAEANLDGYAQDKEGSGQG